VLERRYIRAVDLADRAQRPHHPLIVGGRVQSPERGDRGGALSPPSPAAAGGGLAGAWLGFNATDGLLSLITAIVGATVGANLILLALDISWDRQARDRVDGTNAAEAKAHAATH
jgi:hypothetical protein